MKFRYFKSTRKTNQCSSKTVGKYSCRKNNVEQILEPKNNRYLTGKEIKKDYPS
jgi:hypothetical protein